MAHGWAQTTSPSGWSGAVRNRRTQGRPYSRGRAAEWTGQESPAAPWTQRGFRCWQLRMKNTKKKLVCGRTQTETSYAAATPRRRRQLEAEDGTSLLFSTGPFLIDCRQLLVISLFCASALRGCLDSVASHGLILFLSCTLFFPEVLVEPGDQMASCGTVWILCFRCVCRAVWWHMVLIATKRFPDPDVWMPLPIHEATLPVAPDAVYLNSSFFFSASSSSVNSHWKLVAGRGIALNKKNQSFCLFFREKFF